MALTLRDLVLTEWRVPRSWPRALIYAAVVVGCAIASRDTTWLTEPVPLSADNHARMSLNLAFACVYCGVMAARSPFKPSEQMAITPADTTVPLRNLAVRTAGSLEAYCASLVPYTNNENSLMLLDRVMLRTGRGISMADLGVRFRIIRLCLIGLFALALLREGASVALVAALTFMAFDLVRLLQPGFQYSIYSFLAPVVLGAIALYGFARRAVGTSAWRVVAATAVMGLYAAFLANLRSEYLPTALALHGVFMLSVLWPAAAADRPRLLIALAGPFMAAYLTFVGLFIWTLPDTGYNYTYHAIAHPLVLSLAVPPNQLASDEGIRWNDRTGLVLARRMDPSIEYLSPAYEHALFAYYFRLWREHPHEMFAIYRAKAAIAGTGAIEQFATEGQWSSALRWSLSALAPLSNGIVFLVVLLGTLSVLLWLAIARAWYLGLMLAMLTLSAWMVQVVSIVIMPQFYLSYHSLLALGLGALATLVLQGSIDGLARLAVAVQSRRRPAPGVVRTETAER